MRIVMDWDLCKGHAACEEEASAVFEVDDRGQLTVKVEEPGAELWEAVRAAAEYCPSQAIVLEER